MTARTLQLGACATVAVWLISGNRHAEAQTGNNVLLVVDDATASGAAIAHQYAQRRGVPERNICHVLTRDAEAISRVEYELRIEQRIGNCIGGTAAQDRILYIVLTKGVPIRIDGTNGRNGTVSSVDSELTLLYRRRSGQQVQIAGFVTNPYFLGSAPVSEIKPFTHEHQDIYLVTRLDGYTEKDALDLVERGAAPVHDGKFVLDERASWNENGNTWLRAAAERLRSEGLDDRVVLDESGKVVTNQENVLGYYSWGSNDPAIRIRHFQLGFVPGALAAMFVSTDGRTFKEPPPTWIPGDWQDRNAYFGGAPQSLVGDLIRDGVTGAAAHVAEPYLDATIRPDILFPAYVRGANLAEAFYAAMPYLSWQTIVLGDPLCAPFRHQTLTDGEIDPGLDESTDLPAYFSSRRLAALPSTLKPEAKAAFLKSEVRFGRGERDAAVALLEKAVELEPQFTAARLLLASNADVQNEFDKAIAQYRAILAYAPNHPIALNNLAFDLAVHANSPADALPFAERVNKLAPNTPPFLDTLAWTQHLMGRDSEAVPAITAARTGAPYSADIRWHAAVIFAAVKDQPRALNELQAALKLNPAMADRADVKELQRQLGAK